MKHYIPKYATDYYSVSEKAGYWLFGKKIMRLGKVKIINNAILASKFKFDSQIRFNIRESLHLTKDNIVVGLVGNFTKAKNHIFLIDIFYELTKISSNVRLLLVGSGSMEIDVMRKCEQLNIRDKAIFLGCRNDVELLLQAMDIFVMPSLFEGMPGAAIEAQASGLPVVLSSSVTKEAKICEHVEFIDLKETSKTWSNQIMSIYNNHIRKNVYHEIVDKGYDISYTTKKLEDEYLRMVLDKEQK